MVPARHTSALFPEPEEDFGKRMLWRFGPAYLILRFEAVLRHGCTVAMKVGASLEPLIKRNKPTYLPRQNRDEKQERIALIRSSIAALRVRVGSTTRGEDKDRCLGPKLRGRTDFIATVSSAPTLRLRCSYPGPPVVLPLGL